MQFWSDRSGFVRPCLHCGAWEYCGLLLLPFICYYNPKYVPQNIAVFFLKPKYITLISFDFQNILIFLYWYNMICIYSVTQTNHFTLWKAGGDTRFHIVLVKGTVMSEKCHSCIEISPLLKINTSCKLISKQKVDIFRKQTLLSRPSHISATSGKNNSSLGKEGAVELHWRGPCTWKYTPEIYPSYHWPSNGTHTHGRSNAGHKWKPYFLAFIYTRFS